MESKTGNWHRTRLGEAFGVAWVGISATGGSARLGVASGEASACGMISRLIAYFAVAKPPGCEG